MPKLSCSCGGVISLSTIPCPDGFVLVHEPAWLELIERLSGVTGNPRAVSLEMSTRKPGVKEAYVCPTCRRMIVIDSEERVAVYVQEEGDPQALLARSGGGTATESLACPSCGNTDPRAMVFVRQLRNTHRMRWAQPGLLEVEADRVHGQKIIGNPQIECSRCYVVFDWPEGVQFMSLHPSNWDT
jgi:hypothetical protein